MPLRHSGSPWNISGVPGASHSTRGSLGPPHPSQDTTDYLRPLSITLSLAMADPSGPVLDEASPTTIRKLVGAGIPPRVLPPLLASGITPGSFQIPFFKECGEDNECVTDLVLKATMDIVGSRYGGSPGCPWG